MPKRNISGLVRKCKELWSNILDIKNILIEDFIPEDVWLDEGITPPPDKVSSLKEDYEESDVQKSEDSEFSLELVKELFEDYIGIVIVGYTAYVEEVLDLEKKIVLKVITGVFVDKNQVIVTLSNLTGVDAGFLKIKPSLAGQFAEIRGEEEIDKETMYRLNFFGGDSIEYADKNKLGKIYYSSSKYIKS